MFKIIYYHYYLFYTRVLPDNEPYATTVFTTGFCQSLPVNFILEFILIERYCFSLGKWPMIAMTGVIILVNYFAFNKSGLGKKIVEETKPKLFGSEVLSVIFTALFCIVTISFMFWGPMYGKYLRESCF